ncbi:hypothetical protein ACFRFH_05935 [Leifsonia sp. NPDC056824]|uniref:hypothetical protein n=1 Tax=Leifsonia sp. NPDC056824 TaxID=3345953 RepID=UPI0036AF3158
MRHLRLFPDWDGPWPLWEPEGEVAPGPEAVSAGLTRRLVCWWRRWSEHYRPGAGWDDGRVAVLWLAEGSRLAADLRFELGPSFDVGEGYALPYGDVSTPPPRSEPVGPHPRRSPYTGEAPVDLDGRIHVRLGPEYLSTAPLLRAPGDGRLSPDDWGLSISLQARLVAWNRDWEEHQAPLLEWDDPAAHERWGSAIPSLVADVQAELGAAYVVTGPFSAL